MHGLDPHNVVLGLAVAAGLCIIWAVIVWADRK